MLKKKTLKLLKSSGINFKNIFSICIGQSFLFQDRFIDYIGNYSRWDTDVERGFLKLDEKIFNVEYIGTTSTSDNFWYSSEVEKIIPAEYINLMAKTRKAMNSFGLKQLSSERILLNDDINGYNLSMIYLAFAPQNVAYFCGSGNTSIYMFVKNLPDNLFEKINSIEFSNKVMAIVTTFNVNPKLMIKALLIENDIKYIENPNEIIAKFNEKSILTIKFDENGSLNISGGASL